MYSAPYSVFCVFVTLNCLTGFTAMLSLVFRCLFIMQFGFLRERELTGLVDTSLREKEVLGLLRVHMMGKR